MIFRFQRCKGESKFLEVIEKMKKQVVIGFLAVLASAPVCVSAQEKADSTESSFSSRPIPDRDILMKRTLWRRVDLKEKQNLPMFSMNNEITRYLLDAAKAGLLDAYVNDSCKTLLSADGIRKNLLVPNQGGGLSAEELAAGFGQAPQDDWAGDKKASTATPSQDDGWGAPAAQPKAEEDDGWGTPKKKEVAAAPAPVDAPDTTKKVDDGWNQEATAAAMEEEFFPNQLSLLEIKEDWIFDKKRSRLYYDVQTITIVLPADQTELGIEKPVASFKYKDVERLFRSDPKRYIWYNDQNTAQHKNLADAFDNRLFWGRITKFANAEDKAFLDIYRGEKEGLIKSLQFEQELMEKEHGLWEY
jgi:gliding motility associated protien GldN